mgnify:CR=1 FL=1
MKVWVGVAVITMTGVERFTFLRPARTVRTYSSPETPGTRDVVSVIRGAHSTVTSMSSCPSRA